MKEMKKILAFFLCFVMVLGFLPANAIVALADETDDLTAALAEAKAYIDGLTINNASNDPATVVSTWQKQFSWDNEKRESNNRGNLYDWSYYNGVVFEGLEYVYEVTGEEVYKDYVVEYMSSLITSGGSWAKTTNNSGKTAAGYDANHGADSFKTASLLLDAYAMTKDNRYLTMAATVYADLDSAANKYSLKNAGNNYRHTWATDPSPDLWLDGLYMILPFRAEYAKYIGDQEELDLIVSRMQWVSDNMYNSSKGLFYHAADSATSNSGNYWLRAMGWYAAAIVDVMDSMEGENLEAMKAQLVKFVDGMKANQNASNGMWKNNVLSSESSSNPYETSGTALVCYAVMKAVNNGWLDESYADMAILAFKGICNEKLENNNLTDICFKGTPGSGNEELKDNEGKGVGPFIMFYAEVLEYVNAKNAEPEVPETTEPTEPAEPVKEEVDVTVGEETFKVAVENVANVVTGAVSAEDKTVVEAAGLENVLVFDMTADFVEGTTKAVISIPVPAGWDQKRVVGISVEDGVLKLIPGTVENGVFSFEVDHFSAKGIALAAASDVTGGTSKLRGDRVTTITSGASYLLYNTRQGDTLTDTPDSGRLQLSGDADASNTNLWYITNVSGSSYYVQYGGPNGQYLKFGQNSAVLTNDRTQTTLNYVTNRSSWELKQGNYYLNDYNDGGNNEAGGYTAGASNDSGSRWELYPIKDVSFTIAPDTTDLQVGQARDLNGVVTVDGSEVDLSDCTIAWSSNASSVVTVSNGTVNGVAGGTATVKAILSAVDGVALAENIELQVTITVQSKTIVSTRLVGSPVTVVAGKEPNYSGVYLEVTYEDGEIGTIPASFLRFSEVDTSLPGAKPVTVTYGEQTFTLIVNVVISYEDLDNATSYPEYPEDGAVRIDKSAEELNFENTGVVRVELDVAGISVKPGVDAVLTIDVSNSMAWEVGTKTDNWDTNKLTEVMKSVVDFANIFLAPNEDGTPTKNTISIVIFAGKDSDNWNNSDSYIDSVRTLVTKTSSLDVINAITANTKFTGKVTVNGTTDYGLQVAYIPEGENQNDVANVDVDASSINRGDTNYDFAFWQTEKTVDKILAANETSDEAREVHVLFMTDGCASNFNGIYYRTKNVAHALKPGTNEAYTAYEADNGTDWTTHIMNTLISNSKGNTYAKSLYAKINGMYAVGFDMVNGSFTGISSWDSAVKWDVVFNDILKNIVQDDEGNGMINVTDAANTYVLNQFYKSLAQELRYAGTAAQVTDTIGSKFTLQMGATSGNLITDEDGVTSGVICDLSEYGITPSITIKTYDLWTKAETGDATKIGTRKVDENGNYIYTTLETVTFNAAGTEAYTNLNGEGNTVNIMTIGDDGSVVIAAKYFTYTKTADGVENFNWIIGNITDKEIVLSFHAYLKGSLEGQQDKGLVYTNEEAYLEYIDINGDYAKQIFPIPAVAWGGASTAYEFYLVNDQGQPVNRQGEVIPFANRIVITGPFYQELHLNQADEYVSETVAAAYVLPAGYTLYDETAKYVVRTASGTHEGVLTISEPAYVLAEEGYSGKLYEQVTDDAGNVSYVESETGTYKQLPQTTIQVSAVIPSYIQSHVAFGVLYNKIPVEATFELTPDVIVIDYGLPVVVNVFNNNGKEEGYTPSLVGFSKYYDNYNMKQKFTDISSLVDYGTSYGNFTIADATVGTARYTPTKFVDGVETVFCAVKMSQGADIYYMVDKLTVIPATTVYYEDEFVTLTTLEKGEDGTYTEKDGWPIVGEKADGVQKEERPGADRNNVYGYDDVNKDMSTYSLGSAAKINVNANQYGTAEFTFYGTGFDVISLTSNTTGTIVVQVKDSTGATERALIVDTYYGYTQDANGEWVLSANTPNSIYQVPVITVEGLAYKQHTVTITVSYADIFDHNEAGNYDFYLDAVRIYDPTGNKDQTANDAYVADGEGWPVYQELRDLVIDAKTFNQGLTNVNGVVFIDSKDSTNVIADYQNYGPNNELYLAAGQAIAFNLGDLPDNVADVQIGMKTNGATVYYKVYNADNAAGAEQLTLNTTTDMYYSIKDLAENGTIVITNNANSGSILTLTTIKITYTSATSGASVEQLIHIDGESATNAVNSLADVEMVKPSFAPETMNVRFNRTTAAIGNNVVITVTTSNDVDDLLINGQVATNKSTSYVTGETVWTFTVPVVENGELDVSIVGFDAEGEFTIPYTESVAVVNTSGTQEDLLDKLFG